MIEQFAFVQCDYIQYIGYCNILLFPASVVRPLYTSHFYFPYSNVHLCE